MSGTKTTWAKIEKGAVVELNGRPYLVEKIKPGKKTAEVKLSHKGRTSKGEVRLKDPVILSTASPTSKRGPVSDSSGTMQRWATKSERPVVDGTAHATVKPLALMRWLIRLVTPPGGVVVDPFAGSGTTLEAAYLEGFESIGVEMTPEYWPLIAARIERVTR